MNPEPIYNKTLSQNIIKQAVKDLRCTGENQQTALVYFKSSRFELDRQNAGYPPELYDAIQDIHSLSEIQRWVLCRDILEFIN